MRHYERLLAWQRCHELALRTYEATRAFPKTEQYGLTSQARRAAFSAAANIVEGSARRGRQEFQRFLNIALGSLSELSYIFRLAKELELLGVPEWQSLDRLYTQARFMTWKLYQAVVKKPSPSSPVLPLPSL